jgi:hypothetical protein
MLIETITGSNNKPYISLEDMINALELELGDLKVTDDNEVVEVTDDNEVVEVVGKILNALINMKKQYYKVKKSGSNY